MWSAEDFLERSELRGVLGRPKEVVLCGQERGRKITAAGAHDGFQGSCDGSREPVAHEETICYVVRNIAGERGLTMNTSDITILCGRA